MGGPACATAAALAWEPEPRSQQLPAQPGCPAPGPANAAGMTGTRPLLQVLRTAQASCAGVHVLFQVGKRAAWTFHKRFLKV